MSRQDRGRRALELALPPGIAALACGLLLVLIGRDPVGFGVDLVQGGLLRGSALPDSIERMAPIVLVGTGLIVAFRGGLWNLGADGQYLVAAAMVAGLAPGATTALPLPVAWLVLALVGGLAGAAWASVPGLLRARYGLNEIVTTLMMSFIGVGVANLLVKGPFHGPELVPQTATLPIDAMLPDLPGTSVHGGVVLAIGAALAVHGVLTRTSLGLRLDLLGAAPRTAAAAGVDVPRVILRAFLASGALVGLAAFVDVTGLFGFLRADRDPALGLLVIPLVLLARLDVLVFLPLAALFGIITIGGEYATRRADLPSDFLLLATGALLLVVLALRALAERSRQRRARADLLADALPGHLGDPRPLADA